MEKAKERFLPAGVVTAIFAVALISGFFRRLLQRLRKKSRNRKQRRKKRPGGNMSLRQ
jgi:hypothetical protein